MTVRNAAYGTYVALTVTNLQSLANDSTDPYACWQSARVDNTATLAVDYEIFAHLPTANTAPANDQQAYLYVVPWVWDGTAWHLGGNFGTTTAPTGAEGTASISDPNSMRMAIAMPYKVAQQILNGFITIAALFGYVPDGWSLVIRNCTGAAFSTGCVVAYRPITETAT